MSQPAITAPVAFYFPPAAGRYEVKPGFYRLGHDFGNGPVDNRRFQFDRRFNEYRQAKCLARREDSDKYICFAGYTAEQDRLVNRFIIQQLCTEYPAYFQLTKDGNRQQLHCYLTSENLFFTAEGDYLDCRGEAKQEPGYRNGFDALAMQLQEDLTIIRLEAQTDRLIAAHLCFPNHWDPRDKIGKNFSAVHQPVPGMKRINPSAGKLFQAALAQGPYIRFAWGIGTDDRLNHHPQPPPGVSQQTWQGRRFDLAQPSAWLRVERQSLTGLADGNTLLFTIRTYHYPVAKLDTRQRHCLYEAIVSMTGPSLEYKGLRQDRDNLLAWLKQEPARL